jgi:hypothetical protein
MTISKPLLISADGFRPKHRWRIDEYGATGALSRDQGDALRDQFGFTADQVIELSLNLGFVLDLAAEGITIEIDRGKAQDKAQKAMAAGLESLMDAATTMTEAIVRLDPLDTSASTNTLWADRFREVHTDWDQAIWDIEDIHRRLSFIAEQKGVAFDLSSVDRRAVPDVRREQVLFTLFTFWEGTGRPLTISTDPETNERGGKLLAFAKMTTSFLLKPCLPDASADSDDLEELLEDDPEPVDQPAGPPPVLSEHTIVADLRRYKKTRLIG